MTLFSPYRWLSARLHYHLGVLHKVIHILQVYSSRLLHPLRMDYRHTIRTKSNSLFAELSCVTSDTTADARWFRTEAMLSFNNTWISNKLAWMQCITLLVNHGLWPWFSYSHRHEYVHQSSPVAVPYFWFSALGKNAHCGEDQAHAPELTKFDKQTMSDISYSRALYLQLQSHYITP